MSVFCHFFLKPITYIILLVLHTKILNFTVPSPIEQRPISIPKNLKSVVVKPDVSSEFQFYST